MNPKQTVNKVHPQVREEATEWFVAFCEREVDASGRESFDRWLRTSPGHIQAYLQISALWQGAGLLVENIEIDIEELAQRALSEDNVLALSADNMPSKSSPGRRTNHQHPTASIAWQAIAACLLLVSAIAGGIVWWQLTRTPMYETGAAEQRTVRFPDGSTVQLNARSRIKLRFTAEQRAVDLIEGQALFSVARNPRRAFVVRSDAARVTAVGTQFDVYRKGGGTVVTVIEGQVAIGVDSLPENSGHRQVSAVRELASSPVLVSAGEQAVVTSRAPMHAYRTNLFAATAWTEGKLVFDSAPLREVVAEFNRIGLRRLVIEDDSLLDLHISGVFPAVDPSLLAGFLRQRFGVTVTETDEEMRVSGAAHK
jgi:transmembrane sensor